MAGGNAGAPVTWERLGRTARITLNRPEKLNALTLEMLDLLEGAAREIGRDAECRGVILDATGEKAFCAGADINAWADLPPLEMWRSWTRRGHEVFEALERLPQPLLVLVDGIAYGGGLELALTGDLLLATQRSRFAFPEVRVAAVPGWGGTLRLAERLGLSRAREMIFTGDPVDAATAAEWGLVNRLYHDRTEMENAARELLDRIAENAPVAVAATKQLLRVHQHSRWTGAAMESLAGGLTAMTGDGAEGIASFREKRPPRFEGR
ncbi:MAG: enoyl-CoA hydratase/isomerase family protein [Spirochaetaceae bacterium]|nr:MAG: enoyl-CoA hydratase/isomerase family protein [Spirochaetaceae bacterium]